MWSSSSIASTLSRQLFDNLALGFGVPIENLKEPEVIRVDSGADAGLACGLMPASGYALDRGAFGVRRSHPHRIYLSLQIEKGPAIPGKDMPAQP